MDFFGLGSGRTLTERGQSGDNVRAALPSLTHSLLTGGLGFSVASACVFATVAYAERWMYNRLGLFGAYFAWTAMFILLGGAALSSLATRPRRVFRFYLLFGLAFFAYAIGWVGAYFTLRGTAGEWVGSLAGSVLMAVVIATSFGVLRSVLFFSAMLLVANSGGYFLGSVLNDAIGGKAGMLLWGVVYGLCLGAGLGAVFHFAQSRRVSVS
jgi:hypothetical protein